MLVKLASRCSPSPASRARSLPGQSVHQSRETIGRAFDARAGGHTGSGRLEHGGVNGDLLPGAHDVALNQPAGTHSRRYAHGISFGKISSWTRDPPPCGEHASRIRRPDSLRPTQLGGQEVHHPLPQVAERRVGAAHPEGSHGDDRAIHLHRRLAIVERGDHQDERQGCDSAGDQPATSPRPYRSLLGERSHRNRRSRGRGG